MEMAEKENNGVYIDPDILGRDQGEEGTGQGGLGLRHDSSTLGWEVVGRHGRQWQPSQAFFNIEQHSSPPPDLHVWASFSLNVTVWLCRLNRHGQAKHGHGKQAWQSGGGKRKW